MREGLGVRLAKHRARLSAADAALWDRVRPLLEKSELRPPTLAELAAALRIEPAKLDSALSRVARQGLLVRVSKTRFFLPAGLRRLEEIARDGAGPRRRDHRLRVPRPLRHRAQRGDRGARVLRPDKIHPARGRRARS